MRADTKGRPRCTLAAIVCLALSLSCGCAHLARDEDPQQVVERMARERQQRLEQAQAAYQAGAKALARNDLAGAADNLAEAVRLDPYHGAARNDLGVVRYREGDLYQAALDFDAASRIMLDAHEPFYNLGVVLEEAGRLEEAAEAYRAALRIAADAVDVKEALARTYIRLDSHRQEAVVLLEAAAAKESRAEWQHWIRLQLLRLRAGGEPVGE